jgi:hypothetical protein
MMDGIYSIDFSTKKNRGIALYFKLLGGHIPLDFGMGGKSLR